MTGEPVLGELYQQARSHLVQVAGRQVLASARLQLSDPGAFDVQVTFGHADPPQGLLLRGAPREVAVGRRVGRVLVLWGDTRFPARARLLASRPPFVVGLHNVWRGRDDKAHGCTGNGGMVVLEEGPNRVVFGCNAGPRELTFEDALVEVSWPARVWGRLLLPGEKPGRHR